MAREYVLMNRDLPVLRFACERNAFDEPEFMELEWLNELRPIGYDKLIDFLARRQYKSTAKREEGSGYEAENDKGNIG